MRLAGGYLALLVLLLGPLAAQGQPLATQQEVPEGAHAPHLLEDPEVGLPFFFEHFSRQDYRQHHQNWAVTQDPRGLIYIANYDGILEYDGATWRLVETPAKTIVRSLAVDDQGVLYAGVQGDFGYLKPDSAGTLRFMSLRDKIAPAHHEFWDVWATHATRKGVYFQTADRLFRWDGKTMKVWESERGFHTSFWVRDQLFVREWGRGLLRLDGDSLHLVPDGERFADLRVYMMAPYPDDRWLIATRQEGLFLYDGTTAFAFPTEIDAWWRNHRLYHGRALPDGHFALAFLDGGGVVLIDKQGRLVRRFDESTGLPDGWVNNVFSDAQNGLWLALNNDGLVRMDFSSPLSFYDRRFGLEGHVNTMERHQGRLYVATTTGLYRSEEVTGEDREKVGRLSFTKILSRTSRALLSAEGVLFVATDAGLFAWQEDQAQLLTEDRSAVFSLLYSEKTGRIYFGQKDGFSFLASTPAGWQQRPFDGGITESVVAMAEATDGTLWLSTMNRKVLRLRLSETETVEELKSFGEEDGLPEGVIQPFAVDGQIFFSSPQGIFRFDAPDTEGAAPRFYRDPALYADDEAPFDDPLLNVFVDDEDSFWLVYPDRIEIARLQVDGSYARETPPVLHFAKGEIVQVYVEDDGITWIGDGNRLIRYDPHFKKRYDIPFSALVRRVTSATGQLIFDGAPTPGQPEGPEPELDYIHNDLRFEFAAPSYNAVDDNQYQYFLEGYDSQWSEWTVRKRHAYFGLSEGAYRFRVRARNAQGVLSKDAVFAFHVLPPWYRTWWAYGLYLAMILAATALYARYRTIVAENKQAQEQARELARERVVNERLQQANRRLQEANDSLMKVDKLKDEFLATTSHELRTPLTAILGFTSVLQDELPGRFQEFLDPIESNSQRLLQTVNSLLELAKLRAGMMEIRREVIDVGELAEEVNRLLAPLAYQKSLLLELISPPEPLMVNLDRRFLERILNNLIGNAIKFTEEGTVSVAVKQKGDHAHISVADTGIGIEEDFIPHLFDEFKQESSGLARSYEGSGLGLTITARLVRLMEGTIEVESKKGKGSVFTVSFPLHRSVEQSSPEPRPVMAE